MKQVHVLVLTAGGAPAIGIIKYLKKQNEIPLKVIAADTNPYAAGLFLADEKLIIPSFREKNFIKVLLSECLKKNISYVYPPSLVGNEGIEILAQNSRLFLQKGVRIFVTDYEFLPFITDKRKMIKKCIDNGILVPKTFLKVEDVSSRDLPLFIKPIIGGGTKDATKIDSLDQLRIYKSKHKFFLIQEYLSLPEYTIDTFADFDSNLIAAVPRLRQTVKDGIATQAKTVNDETLIEYARKICRIFKINGPANIQVFKDTKSKKIYLIEINPKFGSSSCLSFESGLNIPLLYLKLAMGIKIKPSELKFKELTMVRFYNEFFIED